MAKTFVRVKEMNKAAVYCRVSTEDQAQNGTSIESQREEVLKFISSDSIG